MCITFAVSFGVTFAVSFGVTIFGSFLQNGYNSVTRPPIEILRPLFTLQLLILPTRDLFHAQKGLINVTPNVTLNVTANVMHMNSSLVAKFDYGPVRSH